MIMTRHRHLNLLPLLLLLLGSCSDSIQDVGGDRSPPNKIASPSLTYTAPGGPALLEWVAPRDNVDERADHYEIRYSYSFPFKWVLAVPVDDPPEPALPGQPEQYTFAGLDRGRDFYAAIRSADLSGNISAVSDIAFVHVEGFALSGRVIDG